jgi:hypothetical protein
VSDPRTPFESATFATFAGNIRHTTEELEALPVLHQGQADDCHVDDTHDGVRYRVWLNRTGYDPEYGYPYEKTVTVEVYYPDEKGSWVWHDWELYDGDDPDERTEPKED